LLSWTFLLIQRLRGGRSVPIFLSSIYSIQISEEPERMMTKPLQIDISHIELPSMLPICQTSQYSYEFGGDPLHMPPARLSFAPSESKTIFTGIPTTFIIAVSNKRAAPISETTISVTIEGERPASIHSTPFSAIDGMRTATLTVPGVMFENPGKVVVEAIVEFRFETAKQKFRAKETFYLEAPLNIGYRIRLTPDPVCEVSVENTKLQQRIFNVRVNVGSEPADIAKLLNHGEGGSCYVLLNRPVPHVTIFWEMVSGQRCSQTIKVAESTGRVNAPIAIKLGNLRPLVPCLTPFSAKISVSNLTKMELSGELTIRSGPIALFGLNSLQFNKLAPGKVEDLEGWFIPLEEGKVQFPAFQVAIKEGPQFEVDAANGIFVVGAERSTQ
jgi:hypothetical protein